MIQPLLSLGFSFRRSARRPTMPSICSWVMGAWALTAAGSVARGLPRMP